MSEPPGADDLAERLRAAWERLAATDLPAGPRSRLHRQLIAVCDATKVPGADPADGQRRLDGFLETLDSAVSGISENS
jgi:hypothetical protein